MKINVLVMIALLQISQMATAGDVDVVPDATVTKRTLKLQADVSDADIASNVVVTNIRLVDANDAKKISYFTAHPTREALNTTTGEYILIENTSQYICAQLGYGKTIPNSRKKNEKIYLMMGEFIASSADGQNLTLEAAAKSFDNALLAVSCEKQK